MILEKMTKTFGRRKIFIAIDLRLLLSLILKSILAVLKLDCYVLNAISFCSFLKDEGSIGRYLFVHFSNLKDQWDGLSGG